LKARSKVIITGRRAGALEEAKKQFPALVTHVSDAAVTSEREELVAWATKTYPDLNILVNNAGLQRAKPLAEESDDWATRQQEIAINLEAPVHLSSLLTPHLLKQKEAAIINITSGLAFIPCAFAPMYGATKAAMHSFTAAMRPHYDSSNIRIIEIAPPPVKTNLPSSKAYGEDCNEFCNHVFPRFANGEKEIGFKLSEDVRRASRDEVDKRFEGMTKMSFKGPTF